MQDKLECAKCRFAIQDYLAGAIATLPTDVDAHRHNCSSCCELVAAAVRLRLGWARRPRFAITPEFRRRVISAVLSDRATRDLPKRRWRQFAMWSAVAAVLVLAIGMATEPMLRRTRPLKMLATIHPRRATADTIPGPGTLDVRENLASASEALLSLTRRTTEGVIEPTRGLLAIDVETAWLNRSEPQQHVVGPAEQSLLEVRQGAVAGFEPLTNSARRAFAMFTRDIPLDGNKPGS